MASRIVHAEVVGKDAKALQRFFSEAFGWKLNTDNPGGVWPLRGGGDRDRRWNRLDARRVARSCDVLCRSARHRPRARDDRAAWWADPHAEDEPGAGHDDRALRGPRGSRPG